MANGKLPGYLASAKPNPQEARAPWYKTAAPAYAGVMLWFVFWHQVPMGSGLEGAPGFSRFAGGTLAQGLGVAIGGLVLAALLCHFLFYLVPGLMGMKTGLPLYIVGTSTYGATGGFLMPGFLMGVLQFGWLAVNGFFAGVLLVTPFFDNPNEVVGSLAQILVSSGWIVLGAFVGVKGIQYVGKVATFIPLIPLAILIVLFVSTVGGVTDFDHEALVETGRQYTPAEGGEAIAAQPPLSVFGVIALLATYIIGFFATAGAAGADFGMNSRDGKDVQVGGLTGIALCKIVAGGLSLLIVAGAYGLGIVKNGGMLQTTNLMGDIMGEKTGSVFMWLLALAAFPAACFSSFVAANSFKATMPKVKPLYSCGLGAIVAIVLAVTGWAGDAIRVFEVIGASFGPVCGAMAADYLLAGRKWPGPRAGFNLAGWISWVVGFVVGAANFIPPLAGKIPCPPMAAFIVGFVLYLLLALLGLQGKTLELPAMKAGPTPEAEVPPAPEAEAPAP
ncbi:MAG: cytosine permease [Phycisphaerae bacterium]